VSFFPLVIRSMYSFSSFLPMSLMIVSPPVAMITNTAMAIPCMSVIVLSPVG